MKPITVTNELIASLNPCRSRYYNYLKYYKNTKFDIIDFLELENITASDKIWVSVRILPSYILEVFIIDCAFCAAAYAAYAAYAANYTGDAAAAGDAAYAATYAAYAANYTGDATGDATRAAAGDAAYAAAVAATRAAAAGDAAYAATRAAAGDAAYSQEQENQVDALIMLLKLNNYKPRKR